MPTINVVDMQGKACGTYDLSEKVFGIEPNEYAVHAVVKAILANKRQGTQSTLTRTEVRGGGRKPWRHKGTGRARQGCTRAPQWFKGGIALGPKPRCYRITLNKKLKRLALFSVLSAKVKENAMIVVNEIKVDEYKTKTMVEFLKAVGAEGKALIVTKAADEKVYRSAGNIAGVAIAPSNAINVYDLLKFDKLVIAQDAVAAIEEVYGK
jgi:large subunit ribosomal protein L4